MISLVRSAGNSLLLSLLIAFFCAGIGSEKYGYADQKFPCEEDIAKYCKDIKPCEGRIIGCLKENQSKLSGDCKAKIEESLKKVEQAKKACAGDVAKFCKDVKPGGGRIAKCLRKHAGEISAECGQRCGLAEEELKKERQ